MLAEAGVGGAVADEQVARGGGGGGLASVDGKEFAVGAADEEKAAAAEAGVVTVHDAEGEGNGDGGVDGVAAAAQGVNARLGGERVDGGDDAAFAGGKVGACGGEGEENKQEAQNEPADAAVGRNLIRIYREHRKRRRRGVAGGR